MSALTFADASRGRLWVRISPTRGRATVAQPVQAPRWHVSGLPLQGHDLPADPWQVPALFEWQRLDWFFWPEQVADWQPPFTLWRNGEALVERTVPTVEGPWSGQVSLQGYLGAVDWELRDAAHRLVWHWQVEVFPQRLGYRADFRAMVQDLQDWLAGLAFAKHGPTRLHLRAGDGPSPPWASWWQQQLAILLRRCDRIAAAPDTRLHTQEPVRPLPLLRRPAPARAAWLAHHPWAQAPQASPLPATHWPDRQARPGYDTPANRMLRHALLQVLQQLADLIAQGRMAADAPPLRAGLHRLRHLLRQPWLAEVGDWPAAQRSATLPHLPPAYRAFYQQWQQMGTGLQLGALTGLPVAPRDTPTLYEYWCLGYLIRFLQRQPGWQLVGQSLWVEGETGALRLRRGTASWLRFAHPQTGRTATLWYQRTFGADETGTLPQRPDLTLDVAHPGQSALRRYWLEVKYQLQAGRDGWGPPPEALAQVHRYRDAILTDWQREAGERLALRSVGGVVLFPLPGPAEDFATHPSYRSWARVQVGALPAQPGQRQQPLLDEWLGEILADESMVQEAPTPYVQRDRAVRRARAAARAWLLPLPDDAFAAARLAWLQREQGWYLPWQQSVPQVETLGLVGPGGQWLGVGEGLRLRLAWAQDLRARGVTWPLRAAGGKYLLLHWQRWTPLAMPLPAGWPGNTSALAMDWAREQARPELLWLQTPDHLRRWQEAVALDPQTRLTGTQRELRLHLTWRGTTYWLAWIADETEPYWGRGPRVLGPLSIEEALREALRRDA